MEAAFQTITCVCTRFLLLLEPVASLQVPSPGLGWPPQVVGRAQFTDPWQQMGALGLPLCSQVSVPWWPLCVGELGGNARGR